MKPTKLLERKTNSKTKNDSNVISKNALPVTRGFHLILKLISWAGLRIDLLSKLLTL